MKENNAKYCCGTLYKWWTRFDSETTAESESNDNFVLCKFFQQYVYLRAYQTIP